MSKNFINKLFSLNSKYRKLFLIFADAFILYISILVSAGLNFSNINIKFIYQDLSHLLVFSIFIGISLYLFTGQYNGITRYLRSSSIYLISLRNSLLIITLFFITKLLGLGYYKSSFWILTWLLISGLTIFLRIILRDVVYYFSKNIRDKKDKVIIYGAGNAGAQLLNSLRFNSSTEVVFFVDDNSSLWNRTLGGLPIKPPSDLLINQIKIKHILFAIPSLEKNKLIEKICFFRSKGYSVLKVPSLDELIIGKQNIDSLKPIEPEDLLNRSPVSLMPKLIDGKLSDSIVCVTGAGGSIGSELCRQIIQMEPKGIVLLEHNENSLYNILNKLLEISTKNILIHPVLGCATNRKLVLKTFTDFSVDIVFHAAAYKHVPLVEENPISGIRNNVFSTKVICECALKSNVRNMSLISTDKAVRPKNVMGASKRLAEMIVQAFGEYSNNLNENHYGLTKTNFSMVRFGNVLNSSGSVVPLFKKQILSGGPITLTHPDMERYFMTIPEAVVLVIQATFLSESGDVFLLDMGEPIKIYDLAKKMINLYGFLLKDENNPEGDIEIKKVGLRPGEKLYEELLINAEAIPTKHPLIYKAREKFIPYKDLVTELSSLEMLLSKNKEKETLEFLKELVKDWDTVEKVETNLS